MKRIACAAAAPAALVPNVCQAHIKWFCAYDTTVPPLPIRYVLTPAFAAVALGFAALMFVAYLIDDRLDRTAVSARFDAMIGRVRPNILLIIRISIGALFVALWASGGVILTPELTTPSLLVPWLQLAIAASMLWRFTLLPGALGIAALYVFAIREYGAFHLMDYPIFPAVAVYLGLSEARSRLLQDLRLPVLYAGVSITMMWGAIEKLGYPCWTLPLLADHEELTLGLSFDWFMNIAAFVEFSLAFFMLTGTALLRLACFALLVLLASAVPAFGKTDAIGHLIIIGCLIVMIIAGQNPLRLPAPVLARHGLTRAGMITTAYGGTLIVLFGLYYGSQYLAGR